MLIISIIVLFMSSVEWKWQWFLLSVIESRYFYDSERFQMEWARTAGGLHRKKLCIVGTKAPPPLQTFQLQLQPSQLWKSLLEASKKWAGQTTSADEPLAWFQPMSVVTSASFSQLLVVVLPQCHSDSSCSSPRTSLISSGWRERPSSFRLTLRRESRREATGGTPLK